MRRIVPYKELEAVAEAVGRFPFGAALRELLDSPDIRFSKRTLQRHLDRLVRQGRLAREGGGRSVRYVRRWEFAPTARIAETPDTEAEWLSSEARTLRDSMRLAAEDRLCLPYDAGFLAAYKPDETFYLPAALRAELARLGAAVPADLPAGTYARRVLQRLLIDLSWNSSRLEGNTYSLLETRRLLELGEGAPGKALEETQMILNHKAAIEMLAEQADAVGFNRYTVCNLHALLAENLLASQAAGGRLRSIPVRIGGTRYVPPDIPQRVEEQFDLFLRKAGMISDPFEQAFFAMVHMPYLQPFEDVNKRVSRLAANIPLVRGNLCPLSFADVPQPDYIAALLAVYERRRVEYLRDVFAHAYRRSCARYSTVRQTLGEPDPFRLRHREFIGRLVREVVAGRLGQAAAARRIAAAAENEVPAADRARLAEMTESELLSLHMGNIARHRLRPGEFEAWQAVWR